MIRSVVSRAVAVVGAVMVAAALSACNPSAKAPDATGASASPPVSSSPTPPMPPVPPQAASLAGGACLLLDYGVINKMLGTHFDVAASADKSDSYTCVVQSSMASFPDLTLSITATDLTVTDFKSDVVPKKSKKVTNLGKAGYEIEHVATSSAGPTIEVGWLSGNERLIVMIYAYPPGAKLDADMVGKMDDLARSVDSATV